MAHKPGFKLVSDGTFAGSHLYLDGKELHQITYVNYEISADGGKLTITIDRPETIVEPNEAYILMRGRKFRLERVIDEGVW